MSIFAVARLLFLVNFSRFLELPQKRIIVTSFWTTRFVVCSRVRCEQPWAMPAASILMKWRIVIRDAHTWLAKGLLERARCSRHDLTNFHLNLGHEFAHSCWPSRLIVSHNDSFFRAPRLIFATSQLRFIAELLAFVARYSHARLCHISALLPVGPFAQNFLVYIP